MITPGEQTQLCTFYLAGHHLGIPVARVQEILRAQPLTRVPRASAVVRGLMNLRGRIAIVLDLRRRLGFPDREPDAPVFHIVVESGGGVVIGLDLTPVEPIAGATVLAKDFYDDDAPAVLTGPTDSFEAPPETLQGAARPLIAGAFKLAKGLLLALETEKAVAIHAEA